MVTLKAIETIYAGHRFRSRLEARWAVFYDALGIPWNYEKEGYDLGPAGLYLPDFWLPEQKCWVEIKGDEPTPQESAKAEALSNATEKSVFIFFGPIPYPDPDTDNLEFGEGAWGFIMSEAGIYWDNYLRWTRCLNCGALNVNFNGRADRLPCKTDFTEPPEDEFPPGEYAANGINQGCPRSAPHGDKGYNYEDPLLLAAYEKARMARFEHGEQP